MRCVGLWLFFCWRRLQTRGSRADFGMGLGPGLRLWRFARCRSLGVSIRCRASSGGSLGLSGCSLLVPSLRLAGLDLGGGLTGGGGLGRLLLLSAGLGLGLHSLAFALALAGRGGLGLHRRPIASLGLGLGVRRLGGLLVLQRLLTLGGGQVG